VIAPLASSLLDLDFNLAASNLVDMSVPASPVVTVNPLLVADVNPDSPKPHRIRGPLDSVNTRRAASRSFCVRSTCSRATTAAWPSSPTAIRHSKSISELRGQRRPVRARCEIATHATVAIGTLDLTTRRFIATEVLAGSSVPFGTSDSDRERDCPHRKHPDCERCGVVPKRRNVEFPEHGDGDVVSTTKVVSQKVSSGPQIAIAPDISSISVGQRVTVFGILNAAGTTMDATNATSGLVRLLVTQLNGTVNSAGLRSRRNDAREDRRGRSVCSTSPAREPLPATTPVRFRIKCGKVRSL